LLKHLNQVISIRFSETNLKERWCNKVYQIRVKNFTFDLQVNLCNFICPNEWCLGSPYYVLSFLIVGCWSMILSLSISMLLKSIMFHGEACSSYCGGYKTTTSNGGESRELDITSICHYGEV